MICQAHFAISNVMILGFSYLPDAVMQDIQYQRTMIHFVYVVMVYMMHANSGLMMGKGMERMRSYAIFASHIQ